MNISIMVTLETLVYFPNQTRPCLNFFPYYIESPKLINVNFYPYKPLSKSKVLDCKNHKKLSDHCLNQFNTCTDPRIWTLDREQQRQHFLDITTGSLKLCGYENLQCKQNNGCSEDWSNERQRERVREIPTARALQTDKTEKLKALEGISKEPLDDVLASVEKNTIKTCVTKDRAEQSFFKLCISTSTLRASNNKRANKDVVLLVEELTNQLDHHLDNLVSYFDKFVRKNKELVHNLVVCLVFQRQQHKSLQHDYEKLNQENSMLRMNKERLELLRKKIDKRMTEVKLYEGENPLMEFQLQRDHNELQYLKKKAKHPKDTQNKNVEIANLQYEIMTLKNRQTELMKHYLKTLNFMEEVKENLTDPSANETFHLQRSTITNVIDATSNGNLKELLMVLVYHALKSLGPRDQAMLYNAIKELNNKTCHQSNENGGNSSIYDFTSEVHNSQGKETPINLPKYFEQNEAKNNVYVKIVHLQ